MSSRRAERIVTLTRPAPAAAATRKPLANRELSWLSFNARVLQEAADPTVPLLERLFFCGVFSSNLDEFFSVRVASLRYLLRLGRTDTASLDFNPFRLLHDLHSTVFEQQTDYDRTLAEILASLSSGGIRWVDAGTVPEWHHDFLREHYEREVRPHLEVSFLDSEERPFLVNDAVYLVVEVWPGDEKDIKSWSPSYGFVRVPCPPLPRWVELPGERASDRLVMTVDDVIRYNLDRLCGRREVGRAYAVQLTRDAELYIDEVLEGDLAAAVRRSLEGRERGAPSRFLYDKRSPYVMIHQMQHTLSLTEEDLMIGGRTHNMSDLTSFPRFDRDDLSYPPWPPIPHRHLDGAASVLAKMDERDHVVHTPYQSYEPVVRFVEEAASDPDVDEIWLTVYRVARDSRFLSALIDASEAGKRVYAFMEIQARFDEASNLEWSDRLRAAGVTVLAPTPGLKVHAKIALVVRRVDGERRLYAFAGTGNFNEKTAKAYADHGIFTTDSRITTEIARVFEQLAGGPPAEGLTHLLVAPHALRSGFYALIDSEIEAARRGEASGMILKMNALEDPDVIAKLYEASQAGVAIRLIVRGICRLVPGLPGLSETIEARSIVDRYLEHARIYVFHNGGDERMYLASADWMKRNLSKRVEVAVPVYDPDVRRQLRRLLDLQLADNVKARRIDPEQTNAYVPRRGEPIRAQDAFRHFLRSL